MVQKFVVRIKGTTRYLWDLGQKPNDPSGRPVSDWLYCERATLDPRVKLFNSASDAQDAM
jgi:hypothetical protein